MQVKTVSLFACFFLCFAAPSSYASLHAASPVRVDVRTSFGGRLATGVERIGTPSGGTPEAFDTTAKPDGWLSLSSESESKAICIRNGIGVLGGRLPVGVATEFSVSTNLIRHNLVVPSGSTARFPFGTVLKFTENAGLVAESGSLLDFRGVALADALDDSVGGDADLGYGDATGGFTGNRVSASGHAFSVLSFVDRGQTFGPALHWTATGGSSTYGRLPRPPDEADRHFVGWFTESTEGTQVLDDSVVAPGARTLYAKWAANTYAVTLNRQGGTGGTANVTATSGSAMPAVTVPARTGYTFDGYYTAANGGGTQYYTAAGTSARTWDGTADTTLYAKWTVNTYAVTLDRQSGSGGSATVTATYGNAMPSITVPTRTGYTFGGYYTSTGGGGTQYYTASGASVRNWNRTAATTLYAKWTANTYPVTLDRQGGFDGTASVTATYGSAMPSIAVPTRTGYIFGGYYTSTGGSGKQYYTASGVSARNWNMTVTTTLYAKWTANSSLSPVHRFYSKAYKGHFFTISEEEKDDLIAHNPNWKYEGPAYRAYTNAASGTVPLYRFYSKGYRGHFFTIDAEEAETVKANRNWKYEGIAYYVYPEKVEGTVPVFRFWSKGYRHHFYTTNEAEKEELRFYNPNWEYEGIAFYALSAEATGQGRAVASGAPEGGAFGKRALPEAEGDVLDGGTPGGRALQETGGVVIRGAGVFPMGAWTIEVREEAPDAEELSAGLHERPTPSAFPTLHVALPEGAAAVSLWSASAGPVSENANPGPEAEFIPEAVGTWHWLRALDETGEAIVSLWIRLLP